MGGWATTVHAQCLSREALRAAVLTSVDGSPRAKFGEDSAEAPRPRTRFSSGLPRADDRGGEKFSENYHGKSTRERDGRVRKMSDPLGSRDTAVQI